MKKITSKLIDKEFQNLQTHFRGFEMTSINGKYTLLYRDKTLTSNGKGHCEYKDNVICKNVSGREFYFSCNSIRKFYLRHQPEIIKDFENVISKYKWGKKMMQEVTDYGDKELAKFKEGKNEK